MARWERFLKPEPAIPFGLVDSLREAAHGLVDANDLTPLFKRIADKKYVLLGEASHGTADYYNWRAEISQKLITEKGFSFIAVEGDWPDCYRINRYVRGFTEAGKNAREVLQAFRRWPTWMWANEEIVDLIEWLRTYNADLPSERKIGFYGLDVYSLWESLAVLIANYKSLGSEAVTAIKRVVNCFEPYEEDVQKYASASAFISDTCEDEAVELLRKIRLNRDIYRDGDSEIKLQTVQNAFVIKNAEAYYRAMIRGGAESWNIRDTHMMDTLARLMAHHGDTAKGIVWEHNTHIGDARFTDMAESGEVNLGQLARERYGEENVVLVGFGSYQGGVVASDQWEGRVHIMSVPPARKGSWEDVFHEVRPLDKLFISSELNHINGVLTPRGHRAIGVVYHPEREFFGNFVPTILPKRYDAFIFLDRTEALHPLWLEARPEGEVPDTYPSAM
jgi:erythromycin esterase